MMVINFGENYFYFNFLVYLNIIMNVQRIELLFCFALYLNQMTKTQNINGFIECWKISDELASAVKCD